MSDPDRSFDCEYRTDPFTERAIQDIYEWKISEVFGGHIGQTIRPGGHAARCECCK
jgi:hypothetical protein